MRQRRPGFLFGALPALLAAACGEPAEPSTGTTVRDSAGVRVVEN